MSTQLSLKGNLWIKELPKNTYTEIKMNQTKTLMTDQLGNWLIMKPLTRRKVKNYWT